MEKFPEFYEAKNPPEWATLCPDRRPSFKAHTSLGLAHSAIAFHKPGSEIALYHLELVEGSDGPIIVWKRVWAYEFPETCAACGSSIRDTRQRKLPYRYSGIAKDAPVVCDNCYHDGYKKHKARRESLRELEMLERLERKYR